jgi:hypothetical protein
MDNLRICKASIADYSVEVRSPVLAICQVTDRGVIFTSAEDFEVGDSIVLGFHVRFHEEAALVAVQKPEVRNEFITCEGQVVGSMLCAGADGLPVYEVTLLFTGFQRGDSRTLAQFSQLEQSSPLRPASVQESAGLN